MRRQGILAAMALALLFAAGTSVSADQFIYLDGAWVNATKEICPRVTQAPMAGAGPAPMTCLPVQTTCTPCDSCNPQTAYKICGTFCTAGQQPAGWPYGWCGDYWLRPDSNF